MSTEVSACENFRSLTAFRPRDVLAARAFMREGGSRWVSRMLQRLLRASPTTPGVGPSAMGAAHGDPVSRPACGRHFRGCTCTIFGHVQNQLRHIGRSPDRIAGTGVPEAGVRSPARGAAARDARVNDLQLRRAGGVPVSAGRPPTPLHRAHPMGGGRVTCRPVGARPSAAAGVAPSVGCAVRPGPGGGIRRRRPAGRGRGERRRRGGAWRRSRRGRSWATDRRRAAGCRPLTEREPALIRRGPLTRARTGTDRAGALPAGHEPVVSRRAARSSGAVHR